MKNINIFFATLAVIFAVISIVLTTYSFSLGSPYFMEASFFITTALLFLGISYILKSNQNLINSVFGLYHYVKDELVTPNKQISGSMEGVTMTYSEEQLREKLDSIEEDHPLRMVLQDVYDEMQKKKNEIPVKDLPTKDLDKLLEKAIETEDYQKAEEIKKEISDRNET